jgi:RNA polymerase sigma-70 factor (ECF subfamily)
VIDEKRLVQQLKDPVRRNAAFSQLVSLYKERLYWHVRKIVLNHHDTDDVLQNTFVKIFRNIDGFQENSKLFSWMYRIATNEALAFIKRRAAAQHLDLSEHQYKQAAGLAEDPLFDGDAIQLMLQKAIVTLPPKQQLVFNMKYFDDIPYREMAEILDTSVGALKASYHHAVKKIEEYLKNH